MRKFFLILLAVVLALVAVYFFRGAAPLSEEAQEASDAAMEPATVAEEIESELGDVDLGDLDAEFQAIDQELEQL